MSNPHEDRSLPASSARNLLPIVTAYLPIPIAGAILSAAWDVGATPDGEAGDMFLRGTALTPPLFLPVVLLAGATLARRPGRPGRLGAGAVTIVASAFLAGSTANLPNDLAAADSAGTPRGLTAVHIAVSAALLYNALPRLVRGG